MCGGCEGCGRRASPLTCVAAAFLVLTYTLLGGFLFLALEGGEPPPRPAPAAPLRAATVERLWAITEDLNILYKENWTHLAARELLEFQQVLLRQRAPRDQHRWTFSTSFLYALTLITTIGHGNVTPKSSAGKLVSVAYACVGIPIIMVYLSTLGEALAAAARALYARGRAPRRPPAACKSPGPPGPGDTPFTAALNLWSVPARPPPPPRVPAALALAALALYVAGGALVFRSTERWSFADGCFFSFSSLATIGFGELRPGAGAGGSSPAEDVAVGVCCLYILVGIAVVAACFNLIREDAGAALRGAAARCAGGGRAVHAAGGAAGAEAGVS